jgi:hypothetical protein
MAPSRRRLEVVGGRSAGGEPVAKLLDAPLVQLADPSLALRRDRFVAAHPRDTLKRGPGGRNPSVHLLKAGVRILDDPEPPDQRFQRQPVADDRREDDGVGEQDDQVAIRDWAALGLERDGERQCERDRSAQATPPRHHSLLPVRERLLAAQPCRDAHANV